MQEDHNRILTQSLQRVFSNPICQKTYISLPKIYGLKNYVYKRKVKKDFSTKESQQLSNKQHLKEQLDNKNNNISLRSNKSSSLSKKAQETNKSFIKIRSLSHSKSNNFQQKTALNKILSLTDLQKDHKIIGTNRIIFPQISHSSEQFAQNKYYHKILNTSSKFQSDITNQLILPIYEQLDQERAVTPEPSINIQKNQINLLSHPSRLQNKQSKEFGVQISMFQSNQFGLLMKKNTYFRNFINRTTQSSVKDALTNRTLTPASSFTIPSLIQIQEFVKNYKPLSPSFNILKLTQSSEFNVIPYKNAVYIGEYQNNHRQGLGIMITKNYIFEGNFQKGAKIFGSQCNPDGVYLGQMNQGVRQGKGIFKWNNGEVYDGIWKNGMKHGYGVWKSTTGDSYQGQWKTNKQQGYGTHRHANSVFQGYFVNFLKHGKGKQKFSNGDNYDGQYFQGRPNGWGVYRWSNGNKYEGQFNNGFRQGYGTLTQNGSCYKGHFTKDIKHGIGQIRYSNGKTFKGEFINDQPVV